MSYYRNTTQTPNILFDHLLKELSLSELKVFLIIIRRTVGMIDPLNTSERVQRAWISQKLFCTCCSLSGKAVSGAVAKLSDSGYIEVTNEQGIVLATKSRRRMSTRLYYASRLRLQQNKKQALKPACKNRVNECHTIKLNNLKKSCYNTTQGIKRISDTERMKQIKERLEQQVPKDTI